MHPLCATVKLENNAIESIRIQRITFQWRARLQDCSVKIIQRMPNVHCLIAFACAHCSALKIQSIKRPDHFKQSASVFVFVQTNGIYNHRFIHSLNSIRICMLANGLYILFIWHGQQFSWVSHINGTPNNIHLKICKHVCGLLSWAPVSSESHRQHCAIALMQQTAFAKLFNRFEWQIEKFPNVYSFVVHNTADTHIYACYNRENETCA